MNSREAILSRIRDQQQDSVQLPEFQFTGSCTNPRTQFSDSVRGVGGTCISVPDDEALNTALRELDIFKKAKKVLSLVPTIFGNVDVSEVRDPHQLGDLDLAILPGVFGVAENAAIWLDRSCLGPHRAAFVIPQHLALVIKTDQIVATMHDAYERLNLRDHDFGIFVSGPSKTADIEQALVIGAHGARSCTVFLVG